MSHQPPESEFALDIRPITLPKPGRRAVAGRVVTFAVIALRQLSKMAWGAMPRPWKVDREDLAHAVRAMFDELGGTFSKFGQLVGSSPSLFGDEVAHAFRSMLDSAEPVPYSQVASAIEAEFGKPMRELFAEFDREPIAAASLASVHRAVLADGSVVAVKVLRPGIEESMAVDLAVMHPLFDFLGHQVAVGVFGELPSLVSGLEEQLSEELDLRNEARSMQWFAELCDTLELHRIVVPVPVEGMAGRRVLVMSFIEGVSVDDVERIEALGIDPAPLVHDCVKAWFASALATGAFHGDVHAGNLLMTHDGRLGILDWGIVGRLDDETQGFFRRMLEGALGDATAWRDVWLHTKAIYGEGMQENLGLDDDQMTMLLQMQIEPLFMRPFGEVRLSDLIMNSATTREMVGAGPAEDRGVRGAVEMWRGERRFRADQRDSGARASNFDRSMFLLGKQLVYFERYGKLFLPDTPLLWDRQVFERLLGVGG